MLLDLWLWFILSGSLWTQIGATTCWCARTTGAQTSLSMLFLCVLSAHSLLMLAPSTKFSAASIRGRAKVCVLTEMSLFFLSQINTFNATSSLNKKCNKFMYWIHGQIISCMIIWEPLQRFLLIWNNSFLCFWSLQHLLWSYQWMDAEKRKWVVPKRESSIQRSGFSWKIFLHYWNHFMWKTS